MNSSANRTGHVRTVDPAPCPAGNHPIFVRSNGTIVAHYGDDGLRCGASETSAAAYEETRREIRRQICNASAVPPIVTVTASEFSAANQTRAGADGQSKPEATTARASRGAIIQIVIDTGDGTLTPVSHDYELTEGMIWTCSVFLLPIELLHNLPAVEAAQKIRDGLGYSHGYEAPRTIAFLNALLTDCEANPRATVSVIEAA